MVLVSCACSSRTQKPGTTSHCRKPPCDFSLLFFSAQFAISTYLLKQFHVSSICYLHMKVRSKLNRRVLWVRNCLTVITLATAMCPPICPAPSVGQTSLYYCPLPPQSSVPPSGPSFLLCVMCFHVCYVHHKSASCCFGPMQPSVHHHKPSMMAMLSVRVVAFGQIRHDKAVEKARNSVRLLVLCTSSSARIVPGITYHSSTSVRRCLEP